MITHWLPNMSKMMVPGRLHSWLIVAASTIIYALSGAIWMIQGMHRKWSSYCTSLRSLNGVQFAGSKTIKSDTNGLQYPKLDTFLKKKPWVQICYIVCKSLMYNNNYDLAGLLYPEFLRAFEAGEQATAWLCSLLTGICLLSGKHGMSGRVGWGRE